jgi:hypothetical protein
MRQPVALFATFAAYAFLHPTCLDSSRGCGALVEGLRMVPAGLPQAPGLLRGSEVLSALKDCSDSSSPVSAVSLDRPPPAAATGAGGGGATCSGSSMPQPLQFGLGS